MLAGRAIVARIIEQRAEVRCPTHRVAGTCATRALITAVDMRTLDWHAGVHRWLEIRRRSAVQGHGHDILVLVSASGRSICLHCASIQRYFNACRFLNPQPSFSL